MITISIITVTRNDYKRLVRTVSSVANQTVRPYEFIVIDGCSEDESRKFIAECSAVTTFVSEPDSGIYDAMNKGIRLASGEYLLFLNSGDILSSSDVIQSLSALSDENDVIHGLSRLIRSDGTFSIFGRQRRFLGLSLFHAMIFSHQAALFKRTLFDRFGLYDCRYRIVADYAFILKIVHSGTSFHFVNIVFIDYPLGGISNINEEERLREHRLARFRDYPFFRWVLYTIFYFPKEMTYYKKSICKILFGRDIILFRRRLF